MRAAKLIWGSLLLIGLIILGGLFWFLQSDYEALLQFAISRLNRPDLYDTLQQQYFTPSKFESIRSITYFLIPALLIGLGLFVFKSKRIIKVIDTVLKRLTHYVKLFYRIVLESSNQTKTILGCIMLFVLVRSVYLALHYYPQYDECWNYNYFLSNHPLTSMVAYNNYPLYNLLTYTLLSILPDNTFFLRLPNIILGGLSVLLVFSLAKKYFKSEQLGLLAAAIFSALPVVLFYMLFARGVLLAMVFSLCLLFFFFVKPIQNWGKFDIFFVGVLGAFGCYAMISFPLFIIILWLYATIISIRRKEAPIFYSLLYAGLWLILFTLILYSPIILGSGLGPGLSSGYMKTHFNLTTFLTKTAFISRNQIGFYVGAPIFIVLNIVSLFISQRKKFILINLLLLTLPYFLFLIGINLPARAISFQFLAYLFTLVIYLEIIKNKASLLLASVAGILLCIGFHYISLTHTFLGWSAKRDQGAHSIAEILYKNKLNSLYDQDGSFGYFVPGLQYYYKLRNSNLNFQTNNPTSTRFQKAVEHDGVVFVRETKKYQARSTDKVLYRYQDEAVDYTIYKRDGN